MCCAFLGINSLAAQTWGKGDVKVGGTLSLSAYSGYGELGLGSWGEWMLSDAVAIGGGLSINWTDAKGTASSEFMWSLEPRISYYYPLANRLYLNPAALVGLGAIEGDLGWKVSVVPQLAYQASKHWWIHMQLGQLSYGNLFSNEAVFKLGLNQISLGIAFSF